MPMKPILLCMILYTGIFALENGNKVVSKPISPVVAQTIPKINSDSISKIVEDKAVLALLREKTQSLTEINSRILDTFGLAMNIASIIGGGLLVFIGATWWRNTKFIRSKIQEVEEKFEKKLALKATELNNLIEKLASTISNGISVLDRKSEQERKEYYNMGYQILDVLSKSSSDISLIIKKIDYASRSDWNFIIPPEYEKIANYIDAHPEEASSFGFALSGLEKSMEEIGSRHPEDLAIKTAINKVIERMQAARSSRPR